MQTYEFFKAEIDKGIALLTFSRPKVNAFSYAVYQEMASLAGDLEVNSAVKVVVFTAPSDARAWIGGADLNDFLTLDHDSRLKRYEVVNAATRGFANFSRPVIGAINSHAVGAGMTFAASQCDIRVVSEDAFFSMPQIDRGLTAGGGAYFTRINMPAGKVREIIFTGRRFPATELKDTGLCDYLLPRDQVVPKSLEIAELIAAKSFTALQAVKRCANAVQDMTFADAMKFTQEEAARLTAGPDSKEGIKAFLEKRDPAYLSGSGDPSGKSVSQS